MPNESDSTTGDFPRLNDVLQKHLSGCVICQATLKEPPRSLGQRGQHCSEYYEIVMEYALWEGEVNNIVGPYGKGKQS